MRKQTKLVAVLSAAALMAIGASATAFADTARWDQQDGEWVYLDRNGDRVTDEWKKSNGYWYYLDEDGYMAKDRVIEDDDDKYYVDSNGVRVTNAWVSMDNDDLYRLDVFRWKRQGFRLRHHQRRDQEADLRRWLCKRLLHLQ